MSRVLLPTFSFFCNLSHLSHSTPTKAHRLTRLLFTRDMKRKAIDSASDYKAKRQREPEADYCDVIAKKDGLGNVIWPASEQSIEGARYFLKEW